MKRSPGILLLLAGLWAVPPVHAAIVPFDQASEPPGFVSQSAPVSTPTNVLTVTAPLELSGFRFTHWTVNGTRRNDFTGRALNPVSITVLEATLAVAHYIPVGQDADSDGLPDWFEWQLFGNLTNGPASDAPADGLTLAQEYLVDYPPLFSKPIITGGVSMRVSDSLLLILDPTLVSYRESSSPAGLITERQQVYASNTLVTTVTPPLETLGHSFAGWEINGERIADHTGVARLSGQLRLTSNTVAVARYLPSGADTDADGLPDWYEWRHLGGLSNSPATDPDGDGIPLQDEYAWNYNPGIAEQLVSGGVSMRASDLVSLVPSNYWPCTIRSDPPGLITQIQTNVPSGTLITTVSLHGENLSQSFAYWSVNGERQADFLGVGLSRVTLVVTAAMDVVAHYMGTTTDVDADGIPDWFEWQTVGSLSFSAQDDPFGTQRSLAQSYAWDLPPRLPGQVAGGGVALRISEPISLNLQPFERPSFALVDGELTRFFAPAGGVPGQGSWNFGSNAAPALGDYDGDGRLDLFIASTSGGLRVFQNVGTRFNMNLAERSPRFAPLAAICSGYALPALALGDWSGDGADDLVVGGSGTSVRLLSSPGHFNSPQAFAVDAALPTGSSSAIPALGDLDGDRRMDLLLLLADGTVDVYTNTGNATLPFAAPPAFTNLLGTPVPQGTGLAVADINDDGRRDILVSDADGRIWEFIGTGGNRFLLASKVWGGSGAGLARRLTLTAADLEGDGDMDALVGTADGGLMLLRDPRYALPSNLRALGGASSIHLEWDPNQQSRIAGYHVYRSAPGTNDFLQLNEARTALPRYDDTLPVPGTSNHYRVTAISGVIYPGNSVPQYLESRPSEIVSARSGLFTLTMPDYRGQPGSNTVLQIATPQASGLSGTNLEIRVSYDPALLTPLAQVQPELDTVETTALGEGLVATNNGATANGELVITGQGGRLLSEQDLSAVPTPAVLYENISVRGDPERFGQSGFEFGEEIILAGNGSLYTLTNFAFEYFGYGPAFASNSVTMTLRFYANDGTNFTPGTRLYESGFFPVPATGPAGNVVNLAGLEVVVPKSFTWTVEFRGLGAGQAGLQSGGLDLYGIPTVGLTYDDYWERSGPDGGWSLRVPAPGNPPINFGCVAAGTYVGPPAIVRPPRNAVAGVGERAVLQVGALGTPPLAYQWSRNGTPIPGATNAALLLTGLSYADSGAFAVEVSNGSGKVTSPVANLLVNNDPSIPAKAGTLFRVRFRVSPSAALGRTYTHAFTSVTLRDAAGNLVPVNSLDRAVFTVANQYFPGDGNGDGALSPADVLLALDLAVGQRAPTPDELTALDLNGNGLVDQDDAQIILRRLEANGGNF